MSLAEDIALAAMMRQRLAELERGIKTETAKINRMAEPWDPAKDRDKFAAAQARVDSVAAVWSTQAPPPMSGEGLIEYRARLAAPYKRFAKDKNLHDIDLGALAASAPKAFENLEREILNDALAAGSAATSVPALQLREVRKRDQANREITEFVGDPAAWLNKFMSHPTKAKRFLTPGWEADALRNAARAVR